jgi:hypothetical protein
MNVYIFALIIRHAKRSLPQNAMRLKAVKLRQKVLINPQANRIVCKPSLPKYFVTYKQHFVQVFQAYP